MANSMVKNINKVVEQARQKYNDLMDSEYIGKDMLVDGVPTKGQMEENERATTLKQERTRRMTCLLNCTVRRGSHIKIKNNITADDYDLEGVVLSDPSLTPVDWFFSVLLFNTTVTRHRKQLVYAPNGDIIADNPLVIDEIPCFVQRIGMRERQLDAGIDRDSVNEIITVNKWDIKKNDILYVGKDRYRVTDVEEIDKEIFSAYMTYYRE